MGLLESFSIAQSLRACEKTLKCSFGSSLGSSVNSILTMNNPSLISHWATHQHAQWIFRHLPQQRINVCLPANFPFGLNQQKSLRRRKNGFESKAFLGESLNLKFKFNYSAMWRIEYGANKNNELRQGHGDEWAKFPNISHVMAESSQSGVAWLDWRISFPPFNAKLLCHFVFSSTVTNYIA